MARYSEAFSRLNLSKTRFKDAGSEEAAWKRWADSRDPKARAEILGNYRFLCLALAVRWHKRNPNTLIEDLFSAAQIEMVAGFNAFDASYQNHFGTYVTKRLNGAIRDYIIKYSAAMPLATTKAHYFLFSNWGNLNGEARRENLSLPTQARYEKIATLASERFSETIDAKDVQTFEARLNSRGLSLNQPLGDDEGSEFTMLDLLPAQSEMPDEILENEQEPSSRSAFLQAALASLGERDRKIIASRFLSEEKLTLHELAAQFGISGERIRQIEAAALKKLRVFMKQNDCGAPAF